MEAKLLLQLREPRRGRRLQAVYRVKVAMVQRHAAGSLLAAPGRSTSERRCVAVLDLCRR